MVIEYRNWKLRGKLEMLYSARRKKEHHRLLESIQNTRLLAKSAQYEFIFGRIRKIAKSDY